MIQIAFIALVLVIVVVSGIFAKARRDRAIAGYQTLASETGLTLTGAYPLYGLQGEFEGVQVVLVHDFWVGHKGRRHYRYDLAVPLATQVGDLSLSADGFLASIGRVFGGQDLQIGDPAFDRAFVVRGSDETSIRRWLGDSVVRDALIRAQERLPGLYVGGGAVHLGGQGVAQPEHLVAQMRVLAEVARAFQGRGDYRGVM